MPYPVSGITTLSQARISSTIAPQGYAKSGLLYALGGFNRSNGNPLEIGRPKSPIILSGADIPVAEKMNLRNMSSYEPRIQSAKTNNTLVRSARGSMPRVGNSTTTSQGQVVQNAAKFYWFYCLTTPMQIWQYDLDMAMSGAGSDEQRGLTMGKLTEDATNIGIEEHMDQLASRLLYGSPTYQSVAPNDDLQGAILAATPNVFYGQADRSTLGADDPWQGVTVSTSVALDIYEIHQNAQIKQKMNVFAGGINLWLCGGDNYSTFKRQILARDKDRGVLPQGLPTMAKYGIEREVLRVDNAYVIHEPFLDTCYAQQSTLLEDGTANPNAGNVLYTAQPSLVLGFNLKLWKLMLHPKYNAAQRGWKDISETAVGNPAALINFIETAAILSCDRPRVGVVAYSNLS